MGLYTAYTLKKSLSQGVQNIAMGKKKSLETDQDRYHSTNTAGKYYYYYIPWKYKTQSISSNSSYANWGDSTYTPENST